MPVWAYLLRRKPFQYGILSHRTMANGLRERRLIVNMVINVLNMYFAQTAATVWMQVKQILEAPGLRMIIVDSARMPS